MLLTSIVTPSLDIEGSSSETLKIISKFSKIPFVYFGLLSIVNETSELEESFF